MLEGVWVVHLDSVRLWEEEWRELGDEPETFQGPPDRERSLSRAGGAGPIHGPIHLTLRIDWAGPPADEAKRAFLTAGCRVDAGRRHWMVTGTPEALTEAAQSFRPQGTEGLLQPSLAGAVGEAVDRALRSPAPLRIGDRIFRWNRTLVMGILNVTPDSFSDGGRYNDVERALARAREMVDQGADLLDIGGESTRPGHVPVSAEEELNRVIPVIRAVSAELDVPISVDTYKAKVAEAAVKAGAHLINDVWGLKKDPEMAGTVAKLGVPVVVMHNRRDPAPRDAVGTMLRELGESLALARSAGIPEDRIILDPGIGFGKTYEQNLQIMRRLRDLRSMGFPVLLGTSRKSMIGKTLGLPVDDRVEGTAATVAFGVAQGADIVRVHDVKEMVRTARMMDAMLGKGE
ncbi:MAG: dihydropteroate synthase [Alicyclobacillaceae bacterium]|nr:dihydropteroate synthase [Alicyclobacillaceae bacterium]